MASGERRDETAPDDAGQPGRGESLKRRLDGSARVPRLLDTAAGWSWRIIIVVGAIVVLGLVVSRLMLVVVAFVVALLIARALTPLVDWLAGHGFPRLLATWLSVLLTVAVLAGIAYWIVPRAVEQFADLDDAVLGGLDDVRVWLVEGPFDLSQEQVDGTVDALVGEMRANAPQIVSGVIGGTLTALQVVVGAVVAFVLSFFFIRDGARLWGWVAKLTGAQRRERVVVGGRVAWNVLGGYILGSVVQGAVESALIGIGLWIIGVPLVFPLVVLVFFAAFFPVVGSFAVGMIAALVALVSGGLLDGLLVVVLVVVVNQLTGNLLLPYIFGRALRVHPALILVAVIVGGLLAGIPGAFLAVPVAAVLVRVTREMHERYGTNGPLLE